MQPSQIAISGDRLALPSEGKGHTFESCRVRQFILFFQRDMRDRTEIPALRHSVRKRFWKNSRERR
jgi:hypothetical protein